MIMQEGFLIYKTQTGEVVEFKSIIPDSGLDPDLNFIPFILNNANGLNDGYIENNIYIQLPPKPDSYHKFDYSTKQWYDPRTLIELKAKKWSEIKILREEEEFSAFIWSNYIFDGDSESQQRIMGAVLAALIDPNMFVDWTLADNTVVTFSSADIIEIGKALKNKIFNLHEYTRNLRIQIENCEDRTQLDSIVWNFIET